VIKILLLVSIPLVCAALYFILKRSVKSEIEKDIAVQNTSELKKIFSVQQLRKRAHEKKLQRIAHGVSDDDASSMLSSPPQHDKLPDADGAKPRKN